MKVIKIKKEQKEIMIVAIDNKFLLHYPNSLLAKKLSGIYFLSGMENKKEIA